MRLQVTGDGKSICLYCRAKLTNRLENTQKFHSFCFNEYSRFSQNNTSYNGYKFPKDHVEFLVELENMIREIHPDILSNDKFLINSDGDKIHIYCKGLDLSADSSGIHTIYFFLIPFINLPKSLAKISTLNSLSIYYSELTKFPKSICKLRNLTNLQIQGCYIESIPKSIGNLTKLEILGVTETNLVSIPESIGKLKNLQLLDLNNNHILKKLPTSTASLKKLKELDIHYTGININDIKSKFPQVKNWSHFDPLEAFDYIKSYEAGM